jgi:hypothetical protein
MNVKELMEILAEMPPEMEIIVTQHSDYCIADSASVEKAIDKDFYIMRWHASIEDDSEVKNYLLIG